MGMNILTPLITLYYFGHDCYWQTCDGEDTSRRTLSRKVQYSRTGTD